MNKRAPLGLATMSILLSAIVPVASAQTPPGSLPMPQMVEPSPPLPGDAAMTCAQIGAEMRTIMQKRNVEQQVKNAGVSCDKRRAMEMTTADQAAMMAQAASPAAQAATQAKLGEAGPAMLDVAGNAGGLMAALSDPRLMRLALMADEKQCELQAPAGDDHQASDPCAAESADAQATRVPTPAASGPNPDATPGKPTPPQPRPADPGPD